MQKSDIYHKWCHKRRKFCGCMLSTCTSTSTSGNRFFLHFVCVCMCVCMSWKACTYFWNRFFVFGTSIETTDGARNIPFRSFNWILVVVSSLVGWMHEWNFGWILWLLCLTVNNAIKQQFDMHTNRLSPGNHCFLHWPLSKWHCIWNKISNMVKVKERRKLPEKEE